MDLQRACKLLEQNDPSLRELYLENNDIGDGGAQALADALRVNSALQEVYLCSNTIGHVGAQAIVDAQRANPKLAKLDLRHELVGGHEPEGLRALGFVESVDAHVVNSVDADVVNLWV